MNMIRRLREAKEMSQAELATLVGTSQPQINRLENGDRKLTKEWAERIAPFLNVPPNVLLFGWPDEQPGAIAPPLTGEDPFPQPNAKVGGKITEAGKSNPVYGQAVGGIDGEFVMNGSALYEVMAPPVLSSVSGAYAVSVAGDSMYPRYEDGEVCFVDPKRRVKKGDYVIAQIRLEEDGPLLAFVKKFVRQNSEELVLEQFNPPKELRFSSQTVHSVHFIVMAGIA